MTELREHILPPLDRLACEQQVTELREHILPPLDSLACDPKTPSDGHDQRCCGA